MKKDMTLNEFRKYVKKQTDMLRHARHLLNYHEVAEGNLERQINYWQQQHEYVSYLNELLLLKLTQITTMCDFLEDGEKEFSLYALVSKLEQIDFTISLYKSTNISLFCNPDERDEDLKYYVNLKEKLEELTEKVSERIVVLNVEVK